MSKKLRIAIVCDSIEKTIGWSYISAQRFALGLSQKGHHIVWLTSRFQDQAQKQKYSYATMYEFPSFFSRIPQRIYYAYAKSSHIKEIYLKEKIDIVYNIHPSLLGIQTYRVAKELNIPVVNHSHVSPETLILYLPKVFHKYIKKEWVYQLLAKFYRKCEGIIFPTAFAKQQFEDYHLDNQQVVISNGVNTDIFLPNTKGKSLDIFNIVHVGRLDSWKNVDCILKALRLLKLQNKLPHKVHCMIVGNGYEDPKLRQLTDKYWLGTIVHFAGRLSQVDQLVKVYQESSVFILPSLYELESMVVLEAMACGSPILVADSPTSAAPHFVTNNGYTFDPYDPQDLADKIYFLSEHPKLLQQMSKSSSENVHHYSFITSIKKIEDFFVSICSR